MDETDLPLVVVTGEVDLVSAERLVDVAAQSLELHGDSPCRLDLSGVTFIDSTGIGALIRIRNDALGKASTLQLVGASRHVLRTLTLTGLSESFGVTGDGVV